MASIVLSVGGGFGILGLGGCGQDSSSAQAPEIAPIESLERVVVTIPPLVGLVAPLVPEGVEVDSLVPPGMTPHGWEPGTLDLAKVTRADLVVSVGLGLESGAIDRMIQRQPTIRIADELGIEGGHHHHHHGHDHGHDHCAGCASGTTDPHLWLQPSRMRAMVTELAGALRARSIDVPAEREGALLAEIDELETWARARLEPWAGQAIVTHHGAFRTMLADLGMVELGGLLPPVGVEPTPGELVELTEQIHAQNVRALFTEPQLPNDGVLAIAERAGLPIGEVDPLGRGEWLGLVRSNIETIARTLEIAQAATTREPSDGTTP